MKPAKTVITVIGGVVYIYLIVFLFYRVYKILDMNFFEELLYFSAYLIVGCMMTISLCNLVEYGFFKEDIFAALVRRCCALVIVVSFAIFLFGTEIDVQCIAGYVGYAFLNILILIK